VNLRISLAVLGATMLVGALALVPGASAQFCPPGQDYNPAGPDYCTTPPPPPPTKRKCPKRKITGTNHDDKLIGSDKAERIYGRGGDDIIKGRGGNDCLFGGSGDDDINGGKGKDRISGGTGDDTIHARDGRKDTIDCGKGHDVAIIDRFDTTKHCEVKRRG